MMMHDLDMPSITTDALYAELLPNIRQVSIIAVLETPSDSTTKAELLPDRKLFLLCHNGKTTSLALPAQVTPGVKLQGPALGNQELFWRLPIADQRFHLSETNISDIAVAPWSASKLKETLKICCRECDAVLVSSDTVKIWKDLPSENWAEMMDFWHCHKPSMLKSGKESTTEHADPNENRAYGANHRFLASPSVGFVDLRYFLLSENDCVGISEMPYDLASKPASSSASFACNKCKNIVGARDDLASGIRIYKWSVSVASPLQQRMTYPLSHFIIAYLLSLISAQAVHKFILHALPVENATKPAPILYIWVFAPCLTISLSPRSLTATDGSTSKGNIIPATKVFYDVITPSKSKSLLDSTSLSVEEIVLTHSVMEEMHAILKASTAQLPPSTQKFREWSVGLLERYVE